MSGLRAMLASTVAGASTFGVANPFMPPPIPAESEVVHTESALQEALNDREPDITIGTTITTDGGITIPRDEDSGPILRCAPGVWLIGSSSRDAATPVIGMAPVATPRRGIVEFIGMRIDGGQVTGETGGTVPGFNEGANAWMARLQRFTCKYSAMRRSKRTLIFPASTDIVDMQWNFLSWCPRDPIWSKFTKDGTLKNNLIMHCEDDIGSFHSDDTETVKHIDVSFNRCFDTNGGVTLGGSAPGTINGKPGGVWYTDNHFYLARNSGIFIGEGASFDEGTFNPRNYYILRNYIENARWQNIVPPACFIGQGPTRTISSSEIEGNTFLRTGSGGSDSGQTRNALYPTYPAPIQEWLDYCAAAHGEACTIFPDGVKDKSSGGGFNSSTTLTLVSSGIKNYFANPAFLDAVAGSNTFTNMLNNYIYPP